jgi:hypothetical protein
MTNFSIIWLFELRHVKTNIVHLRPAWIQTMLCIHAVCYRMSFSTCNRVGKRTAWILIRLRRCWSQTHYVGFVVTRLIYWWHHEVTHAKDSSRDYHLKSLVKDMSFLSFCHFAIIICYALSLVNISFNHPQYDMIFIAKIFICILTFLT